MLEKYNLHIVARHKLIEALKEHKVFSKQLEDMVGQNENMIMLALALLLKKKEKKGRAK